MLNPGMPVTNAAESRFDDARVVAAAQEYLAALESGISLNKDDFIARHPEIAEQLKECLDALEMVHGIAPEMRHESDVVSSPPSGHGLLGDFRLLREIGRGGMGVVYEAVQISLNRRVAVKMLPFAAALDRAHLQRFRNEAQAAAQLHHAHIVPVYAVGAERGVNFYAMQLIDGEPVDRLIAFWRQANGKTTAVDTESCMAGGNTPTRTFTSSGLAATQAFRDSTLTAAPSAGSSARRVAGDVSRRGRYRLAAELTRQAALGLEHAHQFGVVHRDIKPANMLVDEHGNLWITDFGLAHIQADVSLTRTGDVLGTLRYMSPEQAAGNRLVLDHRTDVYSLGATFYELLTLEPVFAESDRHVLVRRIVEEEPRAPRGIDPRIPIELETIVLKAMAKAPQERYLSARQFADDLQRWLDDKPISARRPTLAERAVKWCRRHRSLVKTAAAFVVLAMLGLAASTAIVATEQAKTKDALSNEMSQRSAADESFRQARQAVDAFTELGEQELASDPSLQALRRKFLETSLEYYQSFLRQRRDDPRMQAELTASSDRVERLIENLAALEGFAALPLLNRPVVQDELNIPADRRRQIEEELEQLRHAGEAARDGGATASARPERQVVDALRTHQKRIAALLDPQQMLRLKQIFWQQQGPFAFLNSEVVAALRLSADDRTRIRVLIDETNPERGRRDERVGEMRGPEPYARGAERGERFDGDRPPPRRPGERRGDPRDEGPRDEGPRDEGPRDEGPRDEGPRGEGQRREGPPREGPPREGPPRERPPREEPPPREPPDDFDGPLEGRFRPPGRRPPPDRERPRHDRRDDVRQRFEDAVEEILEMLTDEQREKWQTLIGEPFDVDLHLRPDEWSH